MNHDRACAEAEAVGDGPLIGLLVIVSPLVLGVVCQCARWSDRQLRSLPGSVVLAGAPSAASPERGGMSQWIPQHHHVGSR